MSQAFGVTGLGIEPAGWRSSEGGVPWRASYVARAGFRHFDDLHFGTDWSMPRGTPVLAMEAGRVVETGYTSGRGRYVVVRITGTATRIRYQHLREVKVTRGEKVARGQVVALSGNSGASNGPHLHVELWRGSGGTAVRYNVERLMRGGDKADASWIKPVV
jgi:murein DD-endopeptidase MepM/ murein hydrolase activator NlpD